MKSKHMSMKSGSFGHLRTISSISMRSPNTIIIENQISREWMLDVFTDLKMNREDNVQSLIEEKFNPELMEVQNKRISKENLFIIIGLGIIFKSKYIYSTVQKYITNYTTINLLNKLTQIEEIEEIKGIITSRLYAELLYSCVVQQLPEIALYVGDNIEFIRISPKNLKEIITNGYLGMCEKIVSANKCSVYRGLRGWRVGGIDENLNINDWELLTESALFLEFTLQQDSRVPDPLLLEYLVKLEIKMDERLICHLIKAKRIELIQSLTESGDLSEYYLGEESLKVAIRCEEWTFILWNMRVLQDLYLKNPLMGKGMTEALIGTLENNFDYIEPKLFLCKACIPFITYLQAKSLIEIFQQSILNLKDEEVNCNCGKLVKSVFFLNSHSPMKICILTIELIRLLSEKYSNISHISKLLEQDLLRICLKIQKEMEDDDHYREIILDKALNGKETIKLIQELGLYALLNNDMAEKVVKSFWESNYNVSGSLFSVSTSYQLLFNYPLDSKYDYEKKLRWNLDSSSLQPSFGQFQVWKRAMKGKYIISALFLFLVCLVFQVLKVRFTSGVADQFDRGIKISQYSEQATENLQPRMETDPELMAEFNSLNLVEGDAESDKRFFDFLRKNDKEFDQNVAETIEEFESLKRDLVFIIFACAIFFIYIIQIFFERLFNYLEHRNISYLRLEPVYWTIVCLQTIKIFYNYFDALDMDKEDYYAISTFFSKDVLFLRRYFNEKNGYLVDHAYLMAILWVGCLLSFRQSQILGHLLKIFAHMIEDILKFLILYSIILTTFACIGNILFVRAKGKYDEFYNCFITLYGSSLGEFSYEDFEMFTTERQNLGKIYLSLFLMINLIIAMNLLIALLSTTYAELSEISTPIYLIGIIQERPIYKYSKNYGSLVSSCFPYSIFCFLLTPLLLSKKYRIACNNFILHLEFLPFLIFTLIITITLFLVLLPFAYLKVIIHKAYLIKNKSKKLKKTIDLGGIFAFLFYLLFGLLIGFIQIFVDIMKHIKHIYIFQSKIPFLYSKKTSMEEVSPKLVTIFMQFLQTIKNREIMSVDEFINEIKIFTNLRRSMAKDFAFLGGIFGEKEVGGSEFNLENTISLAEFIIVEEFVKDNIINNSIYPKLLFQIFSGCIELKMMKKIISMRKYIGEKRDKENNYLRITGMKTGKEEEEEKTQNKYIIGSQKESTKRIQYVHHREVAIFKYYKLKYIIEALTVPIDMMPIQEKSKYL